MTTEVTIAVKTRFKIATCAFFTFVCGLACREYDRPQATQFTVYVVGEGLPADSHRRESLNLAQAASMYSGARAAWSDIPASVKNRIPIRIAVLDDDGTPRDATDVAREIVSDSTALAVIGHSASGTTRDAIPLYTAAGIPVLMPIATSEAVKSGTTYRLPMNDSAGQVPALSLLVDSLKIQRVGVVYDTSGHAGEYSIPLTRALIQTGFRHAKIVGEGSPFSDDKDATELARAIHDSGVDGVLYVGYAESAIRFMRAMTAEFPLGAKGRPIVILTDGCINPLLRTASFESYITSPIPDSRRADDATLARCDNELLSPFSRRFGKREPNYEIYGYDAVAILWRAVEQCADDGEVSRACVNGRLQDLHFQGVCTEYHFEHGENTNGEYHAYKVENAETFRMKLVRRFSSGDLRSVNR